MERLIVVTSLVVALLSFVGSKPVRAEVVETCVQVTQYSGAVGVVCGVKHEPVETGLADINPIVLASTFFLLAGASFLKYKKLAKENISL